MTAMDILSYPSAWSESDLSYLPKPNTSDLVITSDPAPFEITKTAIVVALTGDDDLVMANNRSRGEEFVGGHIEPGETVEEAAVREAFEEARIVFGVLLLLGFQRMQVGGPKPGGYAYPYPVSCQQFLGGRVASLEPYVENEECLAPVVIPRSRVAAVLTPGQMVFYQAAVEALAGK
jgi:8-oxo-dGTP diphosphatase